MDAINVKVPTTVSQTKPTTEFTRGHDSVSTDVHQSPFVPDLQHISLVWLICILLAGLAILAALALAIVLVCRRRMLRKMKAKKPGYPPLPPSMVSEFDLVHGGYKDTFDVLFDKKDFKKSSRKSKKSNDRYNEKCEQCLDRGHLECQGHSLSRSSSFGSKDRKNLTFLTPSGFYQHVTDQEGAMVPEAHIYSQLDEGGAAMPEGNSNEPHYGHLCDATSGKPASAQGDEADADAVYAVLEDHYSELDGNESQESGERPIAHDSLYRNVGSIGSINRSEL